MIHLDIALARRQELEKLRQRGVRTLFIVYDLIPILCPQYANIGVPEAHAKWLDVITEADGAICISNTVAIELSESIRSNKPLTALNFSIDFFHLGADIWRIMFHLRDILVLL